MNRNHRNDAILAKIERELSRPPKRRNIGSKIAAALALLGAVWLSALAGHDPVDRALTKVEGGLQSALDSANSEYSAAAERKANRAKIGACVGLRNRFINSSGDLNRQVDYMRCETDLKKVGIDISDYDKDGRKYR
jgi:hypothetical protein